MSLAAGTAVLSACAAPPAPNTMPMAMPAAAAAAAAPAPAPAPAAAMPAVTRLRCGSREVIAEDQGGTLFLTIDGRRYALRPVPAASGAKYAGDDVGDGGTGFWSKGDRASLTLAGQVQPECERITAAAAPLKARGNEPGWLLEIGSLQMRFTSADGAVSRAAATPSPVSLTGGGGRTYTARTGANPFVAVLRDGVCRDSMSGLPHPLSAQVTVGDRRFSGCGGEPSALLQGAAWSVDDIAGTALQDRARVTIGFGSAGEVSGRSGCNTYRGEYTVTGEGIVFSRMAGTMMACPPPLMAEERAFNELITQVKRFDISADGALLLIAADGRKLTARRP
jgi:heat shock protein HslJ/membrane-bound inhibitor of C-type lysozyme